MKRKMGMIEMRETLPSVLRRHRAEAAVLTGCIILAALLGSLLDAAWRALAG